MAGDWQGEAGPTLEPIPFPMAMALSALFGIAVYNSFELYIFILRTFHRRRGLYFWSAICATTGILLISLFCLLRFFGVAHPGLMAALTSASWATMVTGQSLMLYSRLHLVLCNPKRTRCLLSLIICAFLFIEIPVGTLFAINNFRFTGVIVATAYNAMEKIELVIFTLLEGLLSGLYLYEWAAVRKELEITKGPKVRRLFHELVALFVLVLVLDLSLVCLQFAEQFEIQITYKPLVYSIKLKVEIYVLNNLVALVRSSNNYQQGLPFRDQTILLNPTPDNDPRLFQSIHPLGTAHGTARQGSDASIKCGSLSNAPNNHAKMPRHSMGV